MITSTPLLDKLLNITIFLLFFLPPLVFMPGQINGIWVFVDYTHPKLAAIMLFSWLFLMFFSIKCARDTNTARHVRIVIRDPFTILLAFFISYISLTALQTFVYEASLYELVQYWTLFLVFVSLSALACHEKYIELIIGATCLSFSIVVLIGYIQSLTFIPWLRPVGSGANFPSTMGYKNPAALAITGQWFLLLYLGYSYLATRKRIMFILITSLALVETVFIAALQSRTAYFAFTLSLILLSLGTGAYLTRQREKKFSNAVLKIAALLAITFLIFSAVIKMYPKASHRFQMITVYLKHPKKFIETDRATYMLNSIFMANKNLTGVGIGNWRFAYPLYRKVNRRLWFNRYIQVQKAHCDYAQMLGETGWPGLVLWLTILITLLFRGTRNALSADSPLSLFLLTQYLAFLLVMMFDYCIQMPYHKFAFFGVMIMLFSGVTKKRYGIR